MPAKIEEKAGDDAVYFEDRQSSFENTSDLARKVAQADHLSKSAVESKLESRSSVRVTGNSLETRRDLLLALENLGPPSENKDLTHDRADLLHKIGDCCLRFKEYGLALEHHQEEYRVGKRLSDNAITGRSSHGLGCVYLKMNRYKHAEKCLRWCLKTAPALKDKMMQKEALDALGKLSYRNRVAEAIQCYLDYLSRSLKERDFWGVIFACGSSGRFLLRLGCHDLASAFLNAENSIAEKIECKLGRILALIDLADLKITQGELERAEEHCRNGLKILTEYDHQYCRIQALSTLGAIYLSKREFDKAYASLKI